MPDFALTDNNISPDSRLVRIVGIGASAGGLEPIGQFIGQIPLNSGMAYIIVQHLDPTKKGLLPELIRRSTSLPVQAAENGMVIRADNIYVIEPNTELTVAAGRIRLKRPVGPRGMRLPIDVLFSSLASAQGERAVAVVLSGMGSDGTLGLQAIKAVGGLTAVQTPESAQFDSMPLSAINTNCADIIGLAAELPDKILTYQAKIFDPASPMIEDEMNSVEPLARITTLLQHQTRHNFSQYKISTLQRRIERRMVIHGRASLTEYADFLDSNPQEIKLLFNELLIGVTEFFRDLPVWERLVSVTLPGLLTQRKADAGLRAWVVGCSTGEEAYSLAIAFEEAIEHLPSEKKWSLQIFASDISPDAIAVARRAEFPDTIKDRISPQRLARFFTRCQSGYRINKSIREKVMFAQHDVLLDPPFTKLDILTCRNLLIYFDQALQRKLLPLFHYSLLPGGVLVLGSSETIGRFNHLFEPIDAKLRLYFRLNNSKSDQKKFLMSAFPPLTRSAKELPLSNSNISNRAPETLQAAADHVLLQVFAPAAVVVNSNGDIVYISGRTGKYLEPAAGKANWNFHSMVREGLRAQLGAALEKASTETQAQYLSDLQVQLPGGIQRVDVTVQMLKEPTVLRDMVMIVFRDVAPLLIGKSQTKAKNNSEVLYTKELQACREQIFHLQETARNAEEELQSTLEEFQSTNEELQSSNEELTTSKEEMQSMNEELQTVNAELQSKLDDLSLAQSDMKNLLNSIEIAILFLDQELNVRRFTDRVSNIFKLRDSDIGRPLSDLNTTLQYSGLHDDAMETLRCLVHSERQVSTSDGHWYNIRIMPYRRLDNMIDGLVITFVDITATKNLEASLRGQVRS